MKYEVIGWTYCGNDEYPPHGTNTACVEAAIAKELQANGYCFGGDAHEHYCPVLNDGTYVSFSWRGWGGVMARALDADAVNDKYAYSLYYMDDMIEPNMRKYPKIGIVDEARIVPKETLAETFVMYLDRFAFDALKKGEKTVEVRPFDELSKCIDYGDYIEFCCENDEGEHIKTKVVDLELDETFEDMFEHNVYLGNREWKTELRYSAKQLGVPENSTVQSLVDEMFKRYGEDAEKHGVIAFIFEKPKHACRTQFIVDCDNDTVVQLYVQRICNLDENSSEFKQLADECFDMDLVEMALANISDKFTRHSSSFLYGDNDEYDVDVNVIIRKTLGELLNNAEKLNAVKQRLCVPMSLKVFAAIAKDSDEPKQMLSLDDDIVEFLHKADVDLQFDYHIV